MLKLINEELMAYEATETVDNGNTYIKMKVLTSNKLQQYDNDTRYESKRADNEQTSGTTVTVSNNGKLRAVHREIMRISAPIKNITDALQESSISKVDFDLPMSVNIDYVNMRSPHVEIRCHNNGEDHANIYLIAFPFNGMINPIPVNPQYRIYKGLITTSVKPIYFNNRKYRKVLYLIIEVNKNLFESDHKYHTDCVDIPLESYAIFKDRDTGEEKTNYEKFTLSITSPNGEYSTNWEYDVVDKPIMMRVAPGQQLWTTYYMKKNNEHKKQFTRNNKKQKPVSIEGNMIVTTNKNGIRKEIPMKNGNRGSYKNNSYHQNNSSNYEGDNLDRMMRESGMFDTRADYDQHRGKRNGGKHKKTRR